MKIGDKVIHNLFGKGKIIGGYEDGSKFQVRMSKTEVRWALAGDLTPDVKLTPEEKRKLREDRFHLWTDEFTGEEFAVEKTFITKFQKTIGEGVDARVLGPLLLTAMGENPKEKGNERRLRGACHYMIHELGIAAVSIRSQKGGYFIAITEEEKEKYAVDQTKFADSMLRTAAAVRALDVQQSLQRLKNLRG